ncbi:MAG: C39 family peptidase [Minisyncoccia bacterium]
MKLTVQYYSQYLDVEDKEWQQRACGVACLKMLLESSGGEPSSIDEMIKDGVALGAYSENGWLHDGLVTLGEKYGAKLYRTEFRKKDADPDTLEKLYIEGVDMIVGELNEGRPVIISAIKNFEVRDKFHMVLVVGAEIEDGVVNGFYYHDPDSYTESKGAYQFVAINIFSSSWRRMAIFCKN